MSKQHPRPNAPTTILLHAIFLALFFSASATDKMELAGGAVLELNDSSDSFLFHPEVEVFADETGSAGFQTIPSVSPAAWRRVYTKAFMSLKAHARYWVRMRLYNRSDQTRYAVWSISSQQIEKARLYTVTAEGTDSSRMSGQSIAIHQRPVAVPDLLFPVELRPQSHMVCYLMLEAGALPIQTGFELLIQNHPMYWNAFGKLLANKGLLSGFMAAFCVFALGMVLFFPKRTHALYFTYILGATLFVAADQGIGSFYLWPYWPQFYGVASSVFLFMCLSSFVFLVYYQLQAGRFHAVLWWLPRIFLLVGLVFISVEIDKSADIPPRSYHILAGMFGILSALSMLMLLGLAIFQFIKYKNEEAGYVTLVFVPLLITSVVLWGTEAGWIAKTAFLNNWLLIISIVTELSTVSIVIMRNQYHTMLRFQMQAQEHKLLRMQEMERIAADLHDEVGSTLSSISILSTFGGGELQAEKIKSRLARINNQTLEVLEIMNDIIWSIKPSHEDTSHIIERMKAFLTNILQDHNISMSWKVNDSLNTLNLHPEQKKNMYLIFKESVNNILKYAQASEITVSIDRSDGEVVMKICDNGRGFNLHESGKAGNGLGNMKMRAQNINGALLIESRTSGGTTVQLSFPLVP